MPVSRRKQKKKRNQILSNAKQHLRTARKIYAKFLKYYEVVREFKADKDTKYSTVRKFEDKQARYHRLSNSFFNRAVDCWEKVKKVYVNESDRYDVFLQTVVNSDNLFNALKSLKNWFYIWIN